MKRYLAAIPVMALFTACSSLQPATTAIAPEANAAPSADIPVVVKKRAAKYAGTVSHSLEYALTNSWTGTAVYKKDVKRAQFVREDGTNFSLNCQEIDARSSLGLVTIKKPYTTFKEASDLLRQQIEYTFATRALACPIITAENSPYNGPALS